MVRPPLRTRRFRFRLHRGRGGSDGVLAHDCQQLHRPAHQSPPLFGGFRHRSHRSLWPPRTRASDSSPACANPSNPPDCRLTARPDPPGVTAGSAATSPAGAGRWRLRPPVGRGPVATVTQFLGDDPRDGGPAVPAVPGAAAGPRLVVEFVFRTERRPTAVAAMRGCGHGYRRLRRRGTSISGRFRSSPPPRPSRAGRTRGWRGVRSRIKNGRGVRLPDCRPSRGAR